jgi:hypothetical protein
MARLILCAAGAMIFVSHNALCAAEFIIKALNASSAVINSACASFIILTEFRSFT